MTTTFLVNATFAQNNREVKISLRQRVRERIFFCADIIISYVLHRFIFVIVVEDDEMEATSRLFRCLLKRNKNDRDINCRSRTRCRCRSEILTPPPLVDRPQYRKELLVTLYQKGKRLLQKNNHALLCILSNKQLDTSAYVTERYFSIFLS